MKIDKIDNLEQKVIILEKITWILTFTIPILIAIAILDYLGVIHI